MSLPLRTRVPLDPEAEVRVPIYVLLAAIAKSAPEVIFSRIFDGEKHGGTTVDKLGRYFGPECQSIIKEVLDKHGVIAIIDGTTITNLTAWREVLEIFYNEAVNPTGRLHTTRYPSQRKRRSKAQDGEVHAESLVLRDNVQRVWVKFWFDRVNSSPQGPTLFWPLISHSNASKITRVPRYLFRVYDRRSAGTSNEEIVQSVASTRAASGHRVDFLTRAEHESIAKTLVDDHLDAQFDVRKDTDNFMSWSSSFLFAIQYATWRWNLVLASQRCTPAEVFICAVDTTKFLPGQFSRDLRLLEAGLAQDPLDNKLQNFYNLRTRPDGAYDNGEYLSQGLLRLARQSCTFSLEHLNDAGLPELYPEFYDNDADSKPWTNRVKQLREIWNEESGDTAQDLLLAERIADACFPMFDSFVMQSLLLAFKPREVLFSVPAFNGRARLRFSREKDECWEPQDDWDYSKNEPVEVQRAALAIRATEKIMDKLWRSKSETVVHLQMHDRSACIINAHVTNDG